MLASLSIKGNEPRRRATPSFEAVKFTSPHETPGTDFRDEELRKLRAEEDPAYASYIQEELDRQGDLPTAARPRDASSSDGDSHSSGTSSSRSSRSAGRPPHGDRRHAPHYPPTAEGWQPQNQAPYYPPYTQPSAAVDPLVAQRRREAAAAAVAAAAGANAAKPKKAAKSNRFQNKTTTSWISTNTTTTVMLPSATVRLLPAVDNYIQMADQNGGDGRGRAVGNGPAAAPRALPPPQQQQPPPLPMPSADAPASTQNRHRPSEMEIIDEEYDNSNSNINHFYNEGNATEQARLPPIPPQQPATIPVMNPTLYANLNRSNISDLGYEAGRLYDISAPGDAWDEL